MSSSSSRLSPTLSTPLAVGRALQGPWWRVLLALVPSRELFAWARKQRTYRAAWDSCPRADFLLEIASRLAVPGSREHRSVVHGACACARLVLPLVTEGGDIARVTLDTAEHWVRGAAVPDAVAGVVMSAWDTSDRLWGTTPLDATWWAFESAAEAAHSVVDDEKPAEAAPVAAMCARRALAEARSDVSEQRLADVVRSIVPRPPLFDAA